MISRFYVFDAIFPKDYIKSSRAYDLLFGENIKYWLATRGVSCEDVLRFGIKAVNQFSVNGTRLFNGSTAATWYYSFCLRPIITLSSDLEVTSGNGTSDNLWVVNN